MSGCAKPHAYWGAIGIAAGLLVSACATANVVLRRRPDTDTGPLGPFARCEAGLAPCRDDPDYDSSRFNLSHTAFFSLPNCPYGIHEILVQNAGSSDAVAIVRCAAPAASDPGGELPTTALPSTDTDRP